MSDPAVEAAQRAWDDGRGPTTLPVVGNEAPPGLIAAAREMAAPIRAEIERLERCALEVEYPTDFLVGVRYALNRIAKHVYPSEES